MAADTGRGLRIEVLGPVRAVLRGRELDLGPPLQQGVLAILALRANRALTRDELIDGLWGARAPEAAVNGLHVYVGALRRVLEPERPPRGLCRVLVSSPAGYTLRLPAEALDAAVFHDRLRDADRLRAERDLAGAVAAWSAALDLCTGTPLAGVPGPLAEAERTRLAELRLAAIEDRAAAMLHLGHHARVVAELSALVVEHPLRERLRALLMSALYDGGRRAEALSVYAETRKFLIDQLGIEPSQELQLLHRRMLADRDGRAPRAELRDPGRRRAEPVVPRQLPPATPHFAGRTSELATLVELARRVAGAGTATMIATIDGTAGIGKTALAIRFAHTVADRFPDGQLYVDMRGFGPTGSAMYAAEALRGFLEAFEVPPQYAPTSLDGLIGRYRSLIAGRRVLVVLDNSRDAEQVRPLLPGSPTALAVVTSRNQLTGLVAAAGAYPLTLDLLTTADAQEFLVRRLGRARIAAEPQAAVDVVRRCAGLPLALNIAGARAASRPALPLAALAAELRDGQDGLAAFDTGDPATDLRAVFSWSYRALGPCAAKLFRHLAIHPGPDIGVRAAASLADVPVPKARATLRELARAHLVTEHVPGKYALHDLLRRYASELAQTLDPDRDRRAALCRIR